MSPHSAAKKLPTYEDLLNLPPNVRGEILFDQLYTSPRPSPRHQKAMHQAAYFLEEGNRKRTSGSTPEWIFLTEPELHLESNIAVPDIAGWKKDRIPSDFFSGNFIALPPDWVCEIISPSSVRIDRILKTRLYHRFKIPHYWIIDPTEKTLEVLSYQENGYVISGTFSEEDTVIAEPFRGTEIDLRSFWA